MDTNQLGSQQETYGTCKLGDWLGESLMKQLLEGWPGRRSAAPKSWPQWGDTQPRPEEAWADASIWGENWAGGAAAGLSETPPSTTNPCRPQARREPAMIIWTQTLPFSDLIDSPTCQTPGAGWVPRSKTSPSGQLCQNREQSREGRRISGDKPEDHPLGDSFCFSPLVSPIYLNILSPN